MSDTAGQRFVVRLDGAPVEEHTSPAEALRSAKDLKQAAPEQLVTVWDPAMDEVVIVEADSGEF